MPSFKELDQVKDHAKYKAELKNALRTAAGKKFLYFKKHKLTPGRNHLLVVDCDLGISKMLGTPTAEGKCALNEAKQLVMETTKGTWKVRPLKKYVEGFYIEREIWVSADEPEELEEGDTKSPLPQTLPTRPAPPPPPGSDTRPPVAAATGTRPPLPQTLPTRPAPPATPPGFDTKPAIPTATATKPLPQTLPTQPAPPPVAPSTPGAKLNPTTAPAQPGAHRAMPQAPVQGAPGQAAKPVSLPTTPQTIVTPKPAPTLPTRPPPPSTPPTPAPTLGTKPPMPTASKPVTAAPSNTDQVRKERRLSTYMTGKRTWREARLGAEAELQRLEKVIVDSCKGEPFAAEAAAKAKQLFALIAQMDDSIGERLDQASTMEDPERQAHLHKQVVSIVQKNRTALKGNPLAGVVDENPFGKFNVRAQLDSVLAKLETDFS